MCLNTYAPAACPLEQLPQREASRSSEQGQRVALLFELGGGATAGGDVDRRGLSEVGAELSPQRARRHRRHGRCEQEGREPGVGSQRVG